MNEFDIGDLVVDSEQYNKGKRWGIILDKFRVRYGKTRYTIFWRNNDGFHLENDCVLKTWGRYRENNE